MLTRKGGGTWGAEWEEEEMDKTAERQEDGSSQAQGALPRGPIQAASSYLTAVVLKEAEERVEMYG